MTNRELVEGMFDAFQRADLDAAFAVVAPEFEFDNRTEAPGAAGVWRGTSGFLEMMGKVTEAFSEYSLERLDTREDGDRVTLTLREASRGRSSGIALERQIYVTYTVRDGNVVHGLATLEPPA